MSGLPEPADPGRDPAGALVSLSHEMLDRARAGDWDAVAGLETRRATLIRAFFPRGESAAPTPALALALRQVLASDALVTALGEERMKSLLGDLGEMRRGHRARLAYGVQRR